MWHRWHPKDFDYKGAFFLLHGLGDYGQRYQELADFFLTQGIAFATCDLPGHGLSQGKRGHIPSWKIIKEISEHGLAEARALVPGKPIGFGGHSAGGLLALFLLGELQSRPDFSWISSPLLNPRAEQPRWKYNLVRNFSYLFPSMTLSTGVTAEMCRRNTKQEKAEHFGQFHSQVSLHFARILVEIAEVVQTQPEHLPSPLPLLITQGKSDPACSYQFCEELVARLQREDLQLILYPDARHEPFADESKEEVMLDLAQWFAKILQT